MSLYPLLFDPLYKYRIWGGDKLKTVLNKKYDGQRIGESWEISDIAGDETKVSNGPLSGLTLKQLIVNYQEDFLGKSVYRKFGNDFPLLIKFIDAKTPLSIQVHPNDEMAKKRHNSFGKNEMWYVIGADKDAELIVGFNQEIEKNLFKKRLNESSLLEVLNAEKVISGDVFYIPTGRIHAIGAGVLLAEIQQTSNVTYRIFDYDRVDAATGEKRELHNDLAIDVIDFEVYDQYKIKYESYQNQSSKLIHAPYFKTNILDLKGHLIKDYSVLDSFVIYMCVEGAFDLEYDKENFALEKGQTILLPANIEKVNLNSKGARLLEVSM